MRKPVGQEAIYPHINISKNPSSSNKIHTADTSAYSGSPAISLSNSDSTAKDPALLPLEPRALRRALPVDLSPSYAARSFATWVVRFQLSATSNQAPNRFHTLRYLPRSGVMVPSARRIVNVKRPSSIAMSPE